MTDWRKSPGYACTRSGAVKPIQSAAEGMGKIARHKRAVTFTVKPYDVFAERATIAVCGRVMWALERLAEAGARGCTPLSEPAPRWAAYVHTLRGLGVPIETIHEEHDGDFPGTHARYVLRATVAPKVEGGASDGKIV